MSAMATSRMPRAAPKRKPAPWSKPPITERRTSPEKIGVNSDTITRATAKTAMKEAMTASSQLPARKGPMTGISLTSGSTAPAK